MRAQRRERPPAGGAPATTLASWRSEADAWTRCFLDGQRVVRTPIGRCRRIMKKVAEKETWPANKFKKYGTAGVDLAECLPHLPAGGAAAPLRQLSFELRPETTDHHVFMQARAAALHISMNLHTYVCNALQCISRIGRR
jgi:hypothetical protein